MPVKKKYLHVVVYKSTYPKLKHILNKAVSLGNVRVYLRGVDDVHPYPKVDRNNKVLVIKSVGDINGPPNKKFSYVIDKCYALSVDTWLSDSVYVKLLDFLRENTNIDVSGLLNKKDKGYYTTSENTMGSVVFDAVHGYMVRKSENIFTKLPDAVVYSAMSETRKDVMERAVVSEVEGIDPMVLQKYIDSKGK